MVLGLQGSGGGSAAITLQPGTQVAVGSNREEDTEDKERISWLRATKERSHKLRAKLAILAL